MESINQLIFYGNLSDKELFEELQNTYPRFITVNTNNGYDSELWVELVIGLAPAAAAIVAPILSQWLKERIESKKKNGKVTLKYTDGREEMLIRPSELKEMTMKNVEIEVGEIIIRINKLYSKYGK